MMTTSICVTDLNDDVITTLMKDLSKDIKTFLALSSTCKRWHDLSLRHSVWYAAYGIHHLPTAFGPNPCFDASVLKAHVLRYLKFKKAFDSASPKPTAFTFYPMDDKGLENDKSCFLYRRFMFQVTRDGAGVDGVTPFKVACHDMDDSLKLLWKEVGTWPQWDSLVVRSCEISFDNDPRAESEMTVLMQATGTTLLNLKTFSVKQKGSSVELREIRSQHFDAIGFSGSFVHQGKWIISPHSQSHFMSAETGKTYSFQIPQGYHLKSCTFAGPDFIVTHSTRPFEWNSKIGVISIKDLEERDTHCRASLNERISLDLDFFFLGPKPITSLEPDNDTDNDTSPLSEVSFLAHAVRRLPRIEGKTSILNVLAPSNFQLEPSLDVVPLDYSSRFLNGTSQYGSWVFGFADERNNPLCPSYTFRLVFVRIIPRAGGGLEFGPIQEAELPDELLDELECKRPDPHHCIFDEFTGRLYVRTRKRRSGLFVIDFV